MSVQDWTTKDKAFLREWLLNTLRTQVVSITFTKKDQTVRVMNCTLKDDVVVRYEQKTDRVKPVNEEIIAAWDIEKNEWRSFKLDSIKQIHLELR